MEVESSVQMEGIPSVETLFSEHNYFKTQAAVDDVEQMETAESATSLDPATESPSLTQLDSSKDTFETCLIQLLHAYTTDQRGTSPSSAASTPQSVGGVSRGRQATPPFVDISPESLGSLSAEQVSTLVTSNSVNYEVIQQIMAQKQGYQGIPMRTASLLAGNNGGGLLQDGDSNGGGRIGSSGQSSRQQTPDGASPSPAAGGGGGGGVVNKSLSDDAPPVEQSLKNPLVQITPEHLQLLQQQVIDLLRSKQVSLPADMPSHEQQILIQSLLLKQLQIQQGQIKEKQGASSGGGVSSLPQQTSSSVASNLKESVGGSSTTSSTAIASSGKSATTSTLAASVKEESSVSASPMLGSLLSSTKVASQPVAVKEEKKEMNPTSAGPAQSPALVSQSTPTSLSDVKPSLTSLPQLQASSSAIKQPPHTQSESPASTTAKALSTPASASSAVTSAPATRASAGKSGGGGSRKKKGDSNKNEPKKPPMPYNIFFSEVYSTVLAGNPKMTFADASRLISAMWNAMGTDVKQKYYERHEELKQEYQVTLKKFKEQEQQQQQEGEAHQPIKTEDAPATSPENKEGNQLQCAESAMESDEAMETTPQEVKDPSLCVTHGCTNKAVFEKERGPQYCSNECVVMDTRNVFASWVRNRKVRE